MDCDLIFPLSNTSVSKHNQCVPYLCRIIQVIFQVRIELLKKSYTNRYNPFLINVTVNMCDVIAKRNFIPYGTIFWKILKKYTNVNHSCPFTVIFLYILKMSE
ncbi:GH22264 [Drosophila grimshawi]|uniref:GH22264 n=1 Tax=Drosophila grimshawi TaxID=7222 RepID=B4K3H0_DROGR|nr:GH22264 [Drosophila grimshawi]